MATDALRQLSADHCVLLAATYTSEANLDALRILLRAQRGDAFQPELTLQILLTYLPETVDPALYTSLVAEVAGLTAQTTEQEDDAGAPPPAIQLDISSVKELSDSKAHKLAKHLHLLPLDHASHTASLCDDLTARFLIHRAHRVANAGILTFVPQLLDPFLDDRSLLRTWFIATVLPLLRFSYEYYTTDEDEGAAWSLDQLENARAEQAVEVLLSKSLVGKTESEETSRLARDMQCLVGPWMYGASERKRRKISGGRERSASEYKSDPRRYGNELEEKTSTSQEQQKAEAQSQWDSAFQWLARAATQNLPAVAAAVQVWDGPGDVDLGGYARSSYLDEALQGKLELRYAQAAFASVYASDSGTREGVRCAHAILRRIAGLKEYDAPPELAASSVDVLPKVANRKDILQELASSSVLQLDALLEPDHPLTHPAKNTFALLQLFVFSSHILLELGNPLSVVAAAKVRFQYDADEQLAVVTRILHTLTTTSSSKRDEEGWANARSQLIWLWDWSLPRDDDDDELGHGIFSKIERSALEKQILESLLNAGAYPLVAKTYILDLSPSTALTIKDIENVILTTALHHYDNASNGNRTRGGVKKASDIIAAFRKHFPASDAFRQCEALLAATHALSFYALTLHHGVPFQPVNIRVSHDPVGLVEKVLAQNPRSYTKLDDLVAIAVNLVGSGIGLGTEEGGATRRIEPRELARQKRNAERRVVGMVIEAALNEDDFETAYSYVVNRLTASASSAQAGKMNEEETDDISWRAALAAGRHKSAASHISASTSTSTPPKLRRLEQRMELLAQTLLLAPAAALPEVLGVWRKCEEEMGALLATEAAEDEAFNARGEVPGAFVMASAAQERREVGRGGREEEPVGLFDVARGAARAFSRTAFPLRGAAAQGGVSKPAAGEAYAGHARNVSSAGTEDGDADAEGRVRKRDMVANVVTGGLASGIGWVIGATPVDRQQR